MEVEEFYKKGRFFRVEELLFLPWENFSYHGRFFIPWEIFSYHGIFLPTNGDFSKHGRFFLPWEIFPTIRDFFYIPWEISHAKRNHVGQAQRKIVH